MKKIKETYIFRAEIFVNSQKETIFAPQLKKQMKERFHFQNKKIIAKIAQLVEHDLAPGHWTLTDLGKSRWNNDFILKTKKIIAKIAQLVEHDLAKVGVAGSSPVFRSSKRCETKIKGRRSLSRLFIGKSRFSLLEI